jgi:hypothetical protein
VINMRSPDEGGGAITPEQLRLGEEHAVRVGIKAMELLITNEVLLQDNPTPAVTVVDGRQGGAVCGGTSSFA